MRPGLRLSALMRILHVYRQSRRFAWRKSRPANKSRLSRAGLGHDPAPPYERGALGMERATSRRASPNVHFGHTGHREAAPHIIFPRQDALRASLVTPGVHSVTRGNEGLAFAASWTPRSANPRKT